jgi:flagellar motor protein MotB
MSLLCTFFVMLIAFSRIEEHKLMELIGALKGGLGMTPIMEDRPGMSRMSQNLRLTAGSAKQQTLLTEEEISKVASHEQVIERRYAPSSVGGTAIEIMVYLLDEGLALIIQTESVFKEGTAEFLPGTDDLWMSFGDLAAHLDCEVRVIGAVPEDMPIKTPKVRTVWGLASERAIAVQKLLVDQCNYDPERFSIGTRIEGGAQQADAAAAFPPDRIELILMGYRPPFQVTPESVIIREL